MNSTPHLDHEIINTLRGVMEDDFTLLIETFINDSSERIRHLKTIVNGSDADATRRAAHSFKGSSSNIGAAHLAHLCSVMEAHAREGSFTTLPLQLTAIEIEFSYVVSLLQEINSKQA